MLRERRECDVYGTAKDVKRVTVKVTVYGYEERDEITTVPFCGHDLSPRARKRLATFIARGLSKPGAEIEAEPGPKIEIEAEIETEIRAAE